MLHPEIYDIETIVNLFVYVGYTPDNNKWHVFVIGDSINESDKLYKHLTRSNVVQIGFNNNDFDYPIIDYFINNWQSVKRCTGYHLANILYLEGQKLINSDTPTSIFYNSQIIKQIDLFKMWHYNSKSKRTSLKDLQFALRMKNIEEMPIPHYKECNESDIDLVVEYCKNDVYTTYQFYLASLGKTDYPIYKNKNKLSLRKELNKMFHINSYSWSESKIGERLLLYIYCRITKQDIKTVKSLKSTTDKVYLKDCIPYWCDIRSKEFNNFLDIIKQTVVNKDSDISKTIYFHDIGFDFGSGGAHGCIKSGIYKSDDENIIVDADINSLYPSIAKSLKLYPEQLGEIFNEIYVEFLNTRIAEKEKPEGIRNEALVEGFKQVLNIVYGKSKEPESFLYDLMYAYKTIISGQCFICMWAERLVEACPNIKFLAINTDGITFMIPKSKVDDIKLVSKKLQELTGLSATFAFYKQIIIKDVNNYIAEYFDSTKEKEHIKLKGCFEIYKEYHKDPSMRIVPMALKDFFLYNIPIDYTIRNNNDIFNYCIRLKTNSTSKAVFNYLENGEIKEIPLARTTRYYASTTGGSIKILYNDSKSFNQINKQYLFSLFNKYYESDNYNINYNFYITEANKIYNNIINDQLSLF